MEVRFAVSGNLASSGCTMGKFKAKPGREIAFGHVGHFRSPYLEMIIRVSGFIFPGIAGC